MKKNLVGRRGHKSGRRSNFGHFCLSWVCLVYFLRKSTEFHVKYIECQIIFFHLLLLIYHHSCDRCASAPFHRLLFKRPNAPDAPNPSPSTTIVFITDSLQRKEEVDIHRQYRGGIMVVLSIEGGGGGGGMMIMVIMEWGGMVT